MSFIHDIIKIKYSRLGYLPSYPYHLISDKEMFDAFIHLGETPSEFDSTKSYSAGDYVTYQNSIYVCKHDIAPGEFKTADWTFCEYFFDDNYPNPFIEQDLMYNKLNKAGDVVSTVSLKSEYDKLKDYIVQTISQYLEHQGKEDATSYSIPDWIYTYMLGEVVYNNSEYQDIYDTLALLGDNNISNKFTNHSCALCYATSTKYISTLTSGIRPPTVFGEPHVIKQLRLEA